MPLISMASETDYRIELMKDNVYRFTAGHYHAIFVVTEAGILVTDPISDAAALYLKKALASRFDVPVRYLAYSHNHIDHTMGGSVWDKDNITVIAHELAAEDLRWTRAPTAMPDLTFSDKLNLTMGETEIVMQYHGVNNGRGSISMRILPANVLFVVDWIVVGRMPYQDLPGYDIHGMIHATREILDGPSFDLFIGGHADIGEREDVERYLKYLEALYSAVRDGMLAGKNLSTLQAEITLPDYADLRMYSEWLPMNVAGVYRTLLNTSYFNFRSDIEATFSD
ncbi:beta-lactamase [Methylophaga frappieri]|uniref:Beta-lactamase n=2 Tax=Methylophaga frappieri (strain ATCC BAA-2434 / DSM 25690 / JAM7) TaxID=754477 RepID=I1YHW9_METFJ|nr:beta-lactamase [Methylophaga frappieri]